jgi:branched-chain amino acid transport system substrate-binding protein
MTLVKNQSHLLPLRVGMTAALSGRYQLQGQQALLGVQAWVEDTNRTGGIQLQGRHRPVELLVYDDTSDAAQCGMYTERLLRSDHVDILLGPYSSGLTLRAAEVAAQYQHVLWNHGGALEPTSEWTVGLLTPAPYYFHGVIDLVRHTTPVCERIVVIHSTAGAFPRAVAAGAAQYSQVRGCQVAMFPYAPRTMDFTPVLNELAAMQPHLVLGVGRIEDDVRFAQQYARSAVHATAVALIATPLHLFRESLGPDAALFLGPSQWEPGLVVSPDYGPSVQAIVQRLALDAPQGIDYPMAQAYAAGLVVQRCLAAAPALDQPTLLRTARQLDFTTFYGRYRLDPATGRQIGHVMPVVQWQGHQKVVRWPLPHA